MEINIAPGLRFSILDREFKKKLEERANGMGLNNALIPIVAFNIGAKHADRIKKVIRLSGAYSAMTCYALQGFSRGISSLVISALRQVFILLPLASILGKMMGINGMSFCDCIFEK